MKKIERKRWRKEGEKKERKGGREGDSKKSEREGERKRGREREREGGRKGLFLRQLSLVSKGGREIHIEEFLAFPHMHEQEESELPS